MKYFPQKVVSHSNLDPTSPKLESWMVLVIFELTTTVPNPTVSSINFISIPWAVAKIFNNFFFYWFSMILQNISLLKALILVVGLKLISKSCFYLGFIVILPLGIIWTNCFFSYSIWLSTSNVISIFFLELLSRLTVLDASAPTRVTPKSIFWSSIFSSYNFKGIPSPFTCTIILLSPLISKTIS